jgi:cation:H+ antiporter
MLIGAVVLVWVLGFDHAYSMLDGGILVVAFVVVLIVIVRGVARERVAAKVIFEQPSRAFGAGLLALRLIVGAILLGLGAWRLLVGVLALAHPLALPASLPRFELPVLFTLALAIYPMMRSDGKLSSREGLLLMLAWLIFMIVEGWLTFA